MAEPRVRSWIARAGNAQTWRLRQSIFGGGRFDPRQAEAWTAPCRRVLRGGSWNNNPQNLRAANRNRNTTDNRNNNLGFRVGSTLMRGCEVSNRSADNARLRSGQPKRRQKCQSRRDHDFAGRAPKRPGPSMMSTDAALNKLASARMTTAAPVLGNIRAPTGAAGCLASLTIERPAA
jgi:hypothetical protein